MRSLGVPVLQGGEVQEEESFCQLDYPGAAETDILGINNLGQMVGMFTTLTATAGFLYDRGTFSPPMTYPAPGSLTVPNGVNDRGEIVGVFQDAGPGEHSFLYKAGNYEPLTYPGATETAAQGINNSGQVVGSFPDVGGTHGFVHLENVGVFSPHLNCPTGIMTTIRGINNGAQIVGGCFDAQGHEHPFLYIAGALHRILIPGATSAAQIALTTAGRLLEIFSQQQVHARSLPRFRPETIKSAKRQRAATRASGNPIRPTGSLSSLRVCHSMKVASHDDRRKAARTS